MVGDLALILNSIGLAVAFTILAVSANTMSMSIRERRKEIAVLKTLGFSSAPGADAGARRSACHRRARRARSASGWRPCCCRQRRLDPGLNGFGAALRLSPALLAGDVRPAARSSACCPGCSPRSARIASNITAMLRQV